MKQFWERFLQWRGWKVCAAFWVRLWQACAGWSGWKNIFFLPFPVTVMLCAGCGAGLVWVFVQEWEQSLPAYLLYALSAYALTAICVQLPSGIRSIQNFLGRHPALARRLADHEFRFSLGLYLEQLINFGYGVFKIAAGMVLGSAWIGADGIYNLVQALIQLFQILRRRRPGDLVAQWRSYRLCGWLTLLLHLTLTGIVFQMVNWDRVDEQGQIMLIATAAFAFYKFIHAFIELALDRKHIHPIDSSVRLLELAQAIFAIFSLQAGLLHTFGSGERWEHWLNLATGCAVCLLVCATGIYMIHRGSREIRTIKERDNG